MYTDFYFINKSFITNQDSIVFFQRKAIDISPNAIFTRIENCQYNWAHKIRLFWNLSCRIVNYSETISSVCNLKTIYSRQNKLFFISKDGIISMQQRYGNGNQIIDFEQIIGYNVLGMQLYRGKLLIVEHYFQHKHLHFEIDTIVSIAQYDCKNKDLVLEKVKDIIDVDIIGLKSVYITLKGERNTGTKIHIDSIKKW